MTLVCPLLVNQHPSPVDDCPYFENAIAFISVILGPLTSFWYSKRVAALNADLFTSVAPGAAFDSPAAVTTWVLFASRKLTTGTLVVLSWHRLAKPVEQTLLPPLFRWLARAIPARLPHCRHYTPATEYSRGPPHTLSAVPSMIELGDGQSRRRSRRCHERAGGAQCWRRYSPSENAQEKAVEDDEVMLMMHVPLAMFGSAMFLTGSRSLFFDCFSIDEGGCIR